MAYECRNLDIFFSGDLERLCSGHVEMLSSVNEIWKSRILGILKTGHLEIGKSAKVGARKSRKVKLRLWNAKDQSNLSYLKSGMDLGHFLSGLQRDIEGLGFRL